MGVIAAHNSDGALTTSKDMNVLELQLEMQVSSIAGTCTLSVSA